MRATFLTCWLISMAILMVSLLSDGKSWVVFSFNVILIGTFVSCPFLGASFFYSRCTKIVGQGFSKVVMQSIFSVALIIGILGYIWFHFFPLDVARGFEFVFIPLIQTTFVSLAYIGCLLSKVAHEYART